MGLPIIESGISRLQSPNLLVQLRSLWTWLALIVAAVATFSSLIRRSKRVILRFRKVRSVIHLPAPSTYYDSDDDDDVSSSSDDDDGDDADEAVDEDEVAFEDEIRGQNGKSEQDFDWPDLARDGSVVKLWDGGFDRYQASTAVHVASPDMFVSAANGGLRVWDARAADRSACATWQPEGVGRLVGIVGWDDNEVYVSDDVGKLSVVDLRNVVKSPLGTDGGDGLVSWCKNAARCLTRL